MFDFDKPRLEVSKFLLSQCPQITVLGILHALRDTQEFLAHLIEQEHKVPLIFAKPYSKDIHAITSMERMGIRVEQLDYETLENTSILEETIAKELLRSPNPMILIDVGGYFAKPLSEMREPALGNMVKGVVEVTTFGHNRYLQKVSSMRVPVVSIARSPIKDIEAAFVGESAWFAIDSILREVGMSAFGRQVGIVGYGMIGRRVAAAAQANGTHTRIFDTDPLKLLDAQSCKHEIRFSLTNLLQESDIVISATGNMAVTLDDILQAKDGIILASAGSKLHEIDIAGLKSISISTRQLSQNLTEYLLPSKKRVIVFRNGAAVNFLLGSCPDETMDLVFAETIAACKKIVTEDLTPGKIHEVNHHIRQEIADAWLRNRY